MNIKWAVSNFFQVYFSVCLRKASVPVDLQNTAYSENTQAASPLRRNAWGTFSNAWISFQMKKKGSGIKYFLVLTILIILDTFENKFTFQLNTKLSVVLFVDKTSYKCSQLSPWSSFTTHMDILKLSIYKCSYYAKARYSQDTAEKLM